MERKRLRCLMARIGLATSDYSAADLKHGIFPNPSPPSNSSPRCMRGSTVGSATVSARWPIRLSPASPRRRPHSLRRHQTAAQSTAEPSSVASSNSPPGGSHLNPTCHGFGQTEPTRACWRSSPQKSVAMAGKTNEPLLDSGYQIADRGNAQHPKLDVGLQWWQLRPDRCREEKSPEAPGMVSPLTLRQPSSATLGMPRQFARIGNLQLGIRDAYGTSIRDRGIFRRLPYRKRRRTGPRS